MKKLLAFLLAVALILSLCSCSTITEGEVYKKEYRPAFTTVMMLPLVHSNGKTTTTTMVPYIIYYPDRYVVFIKAFVNNEWKTEDYYVPKDTYDTLNIGDMFEYVKDRDLTEEPYTKTKQ